MLHHITWHQYLTGVLVIAVVYYLFVIGRYYRPELQKIIHRLNGNHGGRPDVLQYQPEEPAAEQLTVKLQGQQPEPSGTHNPFIDELKACIHQAADKPFAPAIFLPQLKKLLHAQRELIAENDRPAINELIVNECEKTGTALLTINEVDQWWSD